MNGAVILYTTIAPLVMFALGGILTYRPLKWLSFSIAFLLIGFGLLAVRFEKEESLGRCPQCKKTMGWYYETLLSGVKAPRCQFCGHLVLGERK